MLPHSARVGKLIESVVESGLEIDLICPDHGLLWRTEPAKIIKEYLNWSQQKSRNKAVILYDSMWHSTETMANEIASGLNSVGRML